MKSGKQRRKEITARRIARKKSTSAAASKARIGDKAKVNASLLRPTNSYGVPDFVAQGYYEDTIFRCKDCGKEEVWRSTQQKWWYEVAKGDVWTTAVRCRPCRRKERKRIAEARRVHLEGLAKREK